MISSLKNKDTEIENLKAEIASLQTLVEIERLKTELANLKALAAKESSKNKKKKLLAVRAAVLTVVLLTCRTANCSPIMAITFTSIV